MLWLLTQHSEQTSGPMFLHMLQVAPSMERVLLRLGAHYLLNEKKRGMALDPVANFHLRNGASVCRMFTKGELRGDDGELPNCGLMASYEYSLNKIQAQNQAYLVHGAIAAHPRVKRLLRHPDSAGQEGSEVCHQTDEDL